MNDEPFTLVSRLPSMPELADFSLTITDHAMEPFFPQGSVVYVSASRCPEEFQAGLFYLDGKVLCRQWCEDMAGTLYLLPASPSSGCECISVPASERKKCLCLGSVICSTILPAPFFL